MSSKTSKRSINAKPKNRSVQLRGKASRPVAKSGPKSQKVDSAIRTVLGKGLSMAAKAVVGSIFGAGDYTVKYNSMTGAGGPPQFSSNGNSRSTVVCHREFVSDITGTTAFNQTQFTITPSNSALFPWLCSLAQNYEEYRIHGMIFEFHTTSGMSVSSTNTALGTVIMATQYNPNDLPFGNKRDMENYEFATSGGPFTDFLHPLECKPSLTVAPQLYVQQPSIAGQAADARLTDFGTFTIATVGMQATNIVGELWVSYQVELLKPRLSTSLSGEGVGQFRDSGSGVGTTSIFGSAGTSSTAPTILNPGPANLTSSGILSPFLLGNPVIGASSTTNAVISGINAITLAPNNYAGRILLVQTTFVGTAFTTVPVTNVALNSQGQTIATVTVLPGTSQFSGAVATQVNIIQFNANAASVPQPIFIWNASGTAATLTGTTISIADLS